MSVTHVAALRTTIAAAVATAVGAGFKVKFRASGGTPTADAPNATVLHSNTATGSLTAGAAGVVSNSAIASDAPPTAGTIGFATIETAAGSVQLHCAVATTGSDVNMTNGTTIASGDTISVTSITYTAPL